MLVVYCLDRLSRDPAQGVILTEELEKNNVALEAVTETIESTEVGKLINYIKGFASKLEAEKIKERTTRGRRARAKEGHIPSGGYARLYGYDYAKNTDGRGGRRTVNEAEAKWVKQIFAWLACDKMSTRAIAFKLRELKVTSKTGKPWDRHSVACIVKNPAYIGKTYYGVSQGGLKRRLQPRERWIEIPGVTPPIIDQELFEAAQAQLKANCTLSLRNCHRQYLLRGHLFCRKCGHAYCGHPKTRWSNGQRVDVLRYKCSRSRKSEVATTACTNRSWSAIKLEALVWEQVERVLNDPEIILKELDRQRQEAYQLGPLETEMTQIERELKELAREQAQLLQWALKGFPETTVMAENKRINGRRDELKSRKVESEKRVNASRQAVVEKDKIDKFIGKMREMLATVDQESKRLALDMLDIKVWLDDDKIEVTGLIPVSQFDGSFAAKQS